MKCMFMDLSILCFPTFFVFEHSSMVLESRVKHYFSVQRSELQNKRGCKDNYRFLGCFWQVLFVCTP